MNAGVETADGFLVRAEATFTVLLEQPQMGAPVMSLHPQLAGLRKWRVLPLIPE